MSNIVIPRNTAEVVLRTIPFTLVDATDLYTPEDISVTGVSGSIRFGTGSFVGTTNTITKVNGTVGEYAITLTQAEASASVGPVRFYIQPAGCALTKAEAYIVPSDTFSTVATTTDFTNALFSSSVEPSMTYLGLQRVMGAKIAGLTTGGNTTTEVFKGLRNDGTAGKTRVTETNDGTNRTARTFDTTDDV